MALIYMYRIKVPPGLHTPKVLVDGAVVTTLPNNSYTWFYLSPGTHTIKTKWGFLAEVPDIEFVANVLSHQIYLLENGRLCAIMGARRDQNVYRDQRGCGKRSLGRT